MIEEEEEDDDDTTNKVSITPCPSAISTQETTVTEHYFIKEHGLPSTSAAAIAAAEAYKKPLLHPSNPSHQKPQQQKSMLRKSSTFFAQKVLKKKPSKVMNTKEQKKLFMQHIENKRASSPGFFIKETQPQTSNAKGDWWRRVKKIIS